MQAAFFIDTIFNVGIIGVQRVLSIATGQAMNTKEALKRSLSSESDIKAKIAAFHKKTSGRTKISDAVEGLMELDLITPNDIAKVGLAEEPCNSGFVREELKKIRDRFLHLREEGHEAISHEKIKETVEVLTYLMLPPGSK